MNIKVKNSETEQRQTITKVNKDNSWLSEKVMKLLAGSKREKTINERENIIIEPIFIKRMRNIMHNLCQKNWKLRWNCQNF